MFAKSTLLRIACTLSVLMGIGKLIQVFLKNENPIGPLLIYRENFDSEFYTELLQNNDFRKPKFRLGNANKNSSLAVAIQHHSVNGPKYLYETINVFLTKLSFDDKQTTTFLVFIAGNNKTYAQVVADELKKRFSMEFDLGTIEVISEPYQLLPGWINRVKTKRMFRKTIEQSVALAKSNLEIQYLTSYVIRNIEPSYFLLVDDNIVMADGYRDKVISVANSRSIHEWSYVTFPYNNQQSERAILFHRSSTKHFSRFLLMFWETKLLKYLLRDFVRTKNCGADDKKMICDAKELDNIIEGPNNIFTTNIYL